MPRAKKTFNSGDSPVVTHLTTSPPVRCLNRAERTGSLVFNVLWSNVKDLANVEVDKYGNCGDGEVDEDARTFHGVH
jgi:hypothetical protein